LAKGQYKKWLEEDNLLLLQGWKRDGLTDEQVAEKIGVAARTLERWKASHSQISRALKIGKTKANFAVENKLFQKAMTGNIAAIIFWLKNNWHGKYSDNPKTDDEKALDKAKTELALAEKSNAIEQSKQISNVADKTREKMSKLSVEELKNIAKLAGEHDD
jgi:transcriptional regulator with XRE-family HTH domain